MKCVLITGGERPPFYMVRELIKADYTCIADSGFDWAYENSLEFNMIVGDMDSVKNLKEFNSIDKKKIIQLPEDKDDTDTLFALKHLHSLKPSSITIVGGGGGRIDHLLGIFSLLKTDLAPNIWITGREIIYRVSGLFSLKDFLGSSISVFPLDKDVCSINSYGLKWDLDSVDWKYKSIGISNYVLLEDGWIDSGNNQILIIIPINRKCFE